MTGIHKAVECVCVRVWHVHISKVKIDFDMNRKAHSVHTYTRAIAHSPENIHLNLQIYRDQIQNIIVTPSKPAPRYMIKAL